MEKFEIGDCVILNYCECPSGKLVAVVVGVLEDFYLCKYLNADSKLDSCCDPPMQNMLKRATKVEDFGVKIHKEDGKYWCEQISESVAKYEDGKPRNWQEYWTFKYTYRPEVADLVWPAEQSASA